MIAAAELAAAAAGAYAGPVDLAAGGDVAARLSLSGSVTVIALRGTRPDFLADWARDIDCVPADHPVVGTCHAGFLNGGRAIFPALAAVLEDGRPFILTGHSLGGALAVVAGALLLNAGLRAAELTTFGAPSVGFGRLASALAPLPGDRWRHGADPVPLVPPLYRQDRALRPIGTPAALGLELGDHDIDRYRAALAAVAVQAAA